MVRLELGLGLRSGGSFWGDFFLEPINMYSWNGVKLKAFNKEFLNKQTDASTSL